MWDMLNFAERNGIKSYAWMCPCAKVGPCEWDRASGTAQVGLRKWDRASGTAQVGLRKWDFRTHAFACARRVKLAHTARTPRQLISDCAATETRREPCLVERLSRSEMEVPSDLIHLNRPPYRAPGRWMAPAA